MEIFKAYILSLQKALAAGDATEHTHRPALKTLLESMQEGIRATNEPRADVTSCGKPDMRVSRGAVPLGYLETKDIGKNLDAEEKGEQIKRYLKGLPNFILTDYLEFRWYVNGERRAKAIMGRLGADGKIKAGKDDIAAAEELLGQFLALQTPTIGTAKDLALRMAGLAHIIRGAALLTLENESDTGTLRGWQTAFEKTLLPHLTASEFADMYAQTLTYGLFAADVTADTGVELRRDTAASLLPATNPLLRKLFHHLAGLEVPDAVAWAVDDMVALLNATDMAAVLEDFGKGSLEKDPVVHFYETFLAAYDPERRKSRGVYYTPEPVVSYIVRAIDHLLKERFGRPWGLADKDTLILDPACGTGTFLHSVTALIYDTLMAQGQAGAWKAYVNDHLLPRLFGFELLMAPYAVAHLKLGLLLKERGYDFPRGERLGVYLTNTLDEASLKVEPIPLAGFITEESNAAVKIKKDDPIEVILGNPPYAVHSANASLTQETTRTGGTRTVRTFIGRLIEDYKQVDGKPLGEQNPKMLHDDYVKFLRWGQWRITQTGRGILAMITNHGYLDNPTFRGMRQQVMQTFNEIYLLDLHGNAKKREVCPDGAKDENVFDIQQGVAIGVFVKKPGGVVPPKVFHADLWGLRKGKYDWLEENDMKSTTWVSVYPKPPLYLFAPQDTSVGFEYEKFWNVLDIFPVKSSGVKTHRDHFAFDFDANTLRKRVEDFRNLAISDEDIATTYNLKDTRDWKLDARRKLLAADMHWESYFIKALYRPFDIRCYYHNEHIIELPRDEVMRHMMAGNNISLNLGRAGQVTGSLIWDIVLCNKLIVDVNLFRRGGNAVFPLYLFTFSSDLKGQKTIAYSSHWPSSEDGRTPNFNPDFIKTLTNLLKQDFVADGRGDLQTTFGPEDVFSYAYAIFHSPTYRQRYAEFLKVDFPRLPLTGNKALFAALVDIGAKLTSLHLMDFHSQLITSFPKNRDDIVEEVRYVPPEVVKAQLEAYWALPDETQRPESPAPSLKQLSFIANKKCIPPWAHTDDDSWPGFCPKGGRVYINNDQYIQGVSPEAWAFQVGGYQVLHKWLKDRKGRKLSFDDLYHYQKIVVALTETIRLMAAIDAAIDAHGGWPLDGGDSAGKI